VTIIRFDRTFTRANHATDNITNVHLHQK